MNENVAPGCQHRRYDVFLVPVGMDYLDLLARQEFPRPRKDTRQRASVPLRDDLDPDPGSAKFSRQPALLENDAVQFQTRNAGE
jgi:hypothetical protein